MDKMTTRIITASMTADDLCKVFKMDKPFIDAFLQKNTRN